MSHTLHFAKVLCLIGALTPTGCGGGIAGFAAALGGGNSSGSAPPQITAFLVGRPSDGGCDDRPVGAPKVSPALIRFSVDQGAEVELMYRTGTAPSNPVRLTQLVDCDGAQPVSNPRFLSDGVHSLLWHFDQETDLGPELHRNVQIFARLSPQSSLGDNNSVTIDLGNDPPVLFDPRVLNQNADGEVSQDVPIRFVVADSSEDIVNVCIEYAVIGPNNPIFRPVKDVTQESTPEHSVEDVLARREGSEITFLWDSDREDDLSGQERSVLLRITAEDDVERGATLTLSQEIRVDNNLPPTTILDRTSLEITQDFRGGIPVPYRVRDAENDAISLVLQWTKEGCPFPDLPNDPIEVARIVQSPAKRRQFQIASELPRSIIGRTASAQGLGKGAEGLRVRLPELARGAARVLNSGGPGISIVNRSLEILRGSRIPAPLGFDLDAPTAAVPLPSGLDALVLVRTGVESWKLLRVELATGSVRTIFDSEVSAGDDERIRVDTMTKAATASRILITGFSRQRSEHRLLRARLTDRDGDGVVEVADLELILRWEPTNGNEVWGLASVDSHHSLVTVGNSVMNLRHDRPDVPGSATVLVQDLVRPRGLAVDPVDSDLIYVAEHGGGVGDRGRILQVNRRNRVKRVLVPGADVPRPEAICVEASNRILVVSDDDEADGSRELRGVLLRSPQDGSGRGVTFLISEGYEGRVRSVSSGPDGLRLLALEPPGGTGRGDLAIGGGVLERRTIQDYDPMTQTATVTAPFSQPVDRGQTWRIEDRAELVQPRAGEASDVFVWDSREARGAERFDLRLTAIDSDLGSPDQSRRSVKRRPSFDVDASSLQRSVGECNPDTGVFFPEDLAVADLDNDGDLDFATANFDDCVTVFYQSDGRDFSSNQENLSVQAQLDTWTPRSIDAADFNGDSLADLVVASCNPPYLTLFLQDPSGGEWEAVSLDSQLDASPCPIRLSPPLRVMAADVDQDGRNDLVVIVPHEQRLTVLLQDPQSPGSFLATPDRNLRVDPLEIDLLDVDGDGILDAVVAAQAGVMVVNGLREEETVAVFKDEGVEVRSVGSGDFNNDGRIDVAALVAEEGATHVKVFFQKKDGGFGAQDPSSHQVLTIPDGDAFELVVVDLDGSGAPDLVVAGIDQDEVGFLSVFYQEDGGTFVRSSTARFNCGAPSQAPIRFVVEDIDGDGVLDVFVALRVAMRICTLYGMNCFDYSSSRITRLKLDAEAASGPQTLETIDIDGDGDQDLLVPSQSIDRIALIKQSSPGRFDEEAVILRLPEESRPRFTASGDLNGDGRIDIVSGNTMSLTFSVFLQDSANEFGLFTSLSTGTDGTITDLTLVDLDGSGNLDVVFLNSSDATGAGDGYVGVYYQEDTTSGQNPRFKKLSRIEGTVGVGLDKPLSLLVIDVDGDGTQDLVTASRRSRRVELFLQKAEGFVAGPTFEDRRLRPEFVVAGKFDEDQLLDLMVLGELSDNPCNCLLVPLLQRSLPDRGGSPFIAFESGDTLEFPGKPRRLAGGDIDCDGRDDVALSTSDPTSLFVVRQSIPARFLPVPVPIRSGSFLTNFLLDDVDGDSEPDIVALYGSEVSVEILFGGR